MKILAFLLMLPSFAGAYSWHSFNGPIISPPVDFPKQLRNDLTFYCPLTSNLAAIGRGSTTPTYTRNSIATYISPATGLVTQVGANVPRFEANGYLSEGARTNYALYSDDLTQAATWIAVTMDTAYTATGADGIANHATTITATGANATLLQTIARAAANGLATCWIKRRTGTGTVNITRDGITWTAVTVTSAWTRVSSAVANAAPVIGLQLVTSGDAVDVQYFQYEEATFASSAIPTTVAAVARAADILDCPSASNLPVGKELSFLIDVELYYNTSNDYVVDTCASYNTSGFRFVASTTTVSTYMTNSAATALLNMNVTVGVWSAGTSKKLGAVISTSGGRFYSDGVLVSSLAISGYTDAWGKIRIAGAQHTTAPIFGHGKHLVILSGPVTGWELSLIR